jgi:hypothetical protein
MGQTPEGAKRAAATQRAKYGPNWFSRISHEGVKARRRLNIKGHFGTLSEKERQEMGRKGGLAARGKSGRKKRTG